MGFTIRELIVSVVIVVVLIALTLPVLASVNDKSMVQQSKANLRMLGFAHALYAGDSNDNQWTYTPHDLAGYGNSALSAITAYCAQSDGVDCTWHQLPLIALDVAFFPESGNWEVVSLWGYPHTMLPVSFNEHNFHGETINGIGFGSSRTMFVDSFNSYVNGMVYDPVFYAPKHEVAIAAIPECVFGLDFCIDGPPPFPTYSTSAAALYHPEIWQRPHGEFPASDDAFFADPKNALSFKVPTYSQIRHPHLKTHVMEHFWLQNNPPGCVVGLPSEFGDYQGCHSPFFNHSIDSAPVTLFYDLHVRLLPNSEVQEWDRRTPLWRRDTPFGETGYFLDFAFDEIVDVSHHVLTNGGARGRDTLGPLTRISNARLR